MLSELHHQSTKKVEQILLSHASDPDVQVRETVKQRCETLTEIKIIPDETLLANLYRLKEVWSHALPGATFTQIVSRLAKEAVAKQDPVLKANRAIARRSTRCEEANGNNRRQGSESAKSGASEAERSRAIPAAVRHAVWLRDRGRCSFVNLETGEGCGSKHFIELDHIKPHARGGANTVENLRLRCRAHNYRHSIDSYGSKVANRWRTNSGIRERSSYYVA